MGTSHGLFHDKSTVLPGINYVMGYDTARRVRVLRYYKDEAHMEECLDIVSSKGNAKILVVGRQDEGEYKTHLTHPLYAKQDLFEHIETTRHDISSTELRAKASAEKTGERRI